MDKVVETVDLGEGFEINIRPLPGEHMDLFFEVQNASPSRQKEIMYELAYLTIKRDDPDVTREDVNEIPIGYVTEIVNAVLRANGIDDTQQ